MWEIAEFLWDDQAFKRALALADPSKRDKAATAADVVRQEKRLAAEARTAQARLDRLVKAIADGVIEGADARAERERIQVEQDRLAQRQAGLEAQRAGLAHKIERVRLIQETRTRFARWMKRSKDLLALPMEQQRDLLRALLPLGSGSCIKVVPSNGLPTYPKAKLVPKWRVEISGLLPVEQAELEKAVLGGALV